MANTMWLGANCHLLLKMLMLSTMVPTVTALTVPLLRGYSSACPVLPARLIQMAAASPDSDEPRTIEVCEVTDDGLISECEVREFDKLSSEFGAHHFSSDPEADDELFFEMTTNDDERVHLTLDDWQKLCETEVVPEVLPEVTEDALQKALGPEHVSVSADESRLHLHFGAGRLGLGLVLPAVSASRDVCCGPAAEGTVDGKIQGGLAAWSAAGERQQQGARAERRRRRRTRGSPASRRRASRRRRRA